MAKFWEPYRPPPAGQYHHKLPARVFYLFARVVFVLVFMVACPTLAGLWSGQLASIFGVAGLLLGVLLLVTAMKGGCWEILANDTGIVWSTPDESSTAFLWTDLKGFDIQAREPNRYRLHRTDGTIVEIPASCVGDEPTLQTALAVHIPCLGVRHPDGKVSTLEEIQRPILDQLLERMS